MEREEGKLPIGQLGSVRVEPEAEEICAEARARGADPDAPATRYVWEPPADLLEQVPEGFTFALRCIRSAGDGLRRFHPVGTFEEFIAQAFAGGLALLDKIKNRGPEGRHSYRAMWQFFQRVRRTRQRFSNLLLNATSLRVSRSGRASSPEYSILPENVGLSAQGQEKPWNVGRLLREGTEEARASGISAPKEADCVRHGLVRAARLNPLSIPEQDVLSLIRQALFESIPTDSPAKDASGSAGQSAHEAVTERSLEAIHLHLDEPQDQFDRWFSGPKSSFVPQIAKQKRAAGGPLARELVQRLLLDLGWDAYKYVADCIHTMLWVFQGLIPEPLTGPEAQRFERMHLKQPCFGQLPLVLLHERFPFLQSVLIKVREDPADREAVAILYRLLAYYGEMATRRRAADRLLQARKAARAQGYKGECSLEAARGVGDPKAVQPVDACAAAEEAPWAEGAETHQEAAREIFGVIPADFINEIAERVRVAKGIRCRCSEPIWLDRVEETNDEAATLAHECDVCKTSEKTTVSMTDLRKIALDGFAE
jgi:hypothetical protein